MALEEVTAPGASGLLRDSSWWRFVIRRWEKHHVFPRKFRDKFERVFGQDVIDRYTVKMPDWVHMWLHYKLNWNQRWEAFFRQNPDATSLQVLRFVQQLFKEAKLEDVKLRELQPWK